MKIIIELSEEGAFWVRRWLTGSEHSECRELCKGSYGEYIRLTGELFTPLSIALGAIKSVKVEE